MWVKIQQKMNEKWSECLFKDAEYPYVPGAGFFAFAFTLLLTIHLSNDSNANWTFNLYIVVLGWFIELIIALRIKKYFDKINEPMMIYAGFMQLKKMNKMWGKHLMLLISMVLNFCVVPFKTNLIEIEFFDEWFFWFSVVDYVWYCSLFRFFLSVIG